MGCQSVRLLLITAFLEIDFFVDFMFWLYASYSGYRMLINFRPYQQSNDVGLLIEYSLPEVY